MKLIYSTGAVLEVRDLGPVVFRLRAGRVPIKVNGHRVLDGERTWENCVAACRSCNSSKGSMDAELFAEQIKLRPQPIFSRRAHPTPFNPVIVPMSESRRRYFETFYGFVPTENEDHAKQEGLYDDRN